MQAGVNLKQTDRLFHFDSPLGEDKLLVASFHGTESMSNLFRFHLELVSDDFEIDYDALNGKRVTVGIRRSDGQTFRYFNGFLCNFRQVPSRGRLARYQAEMVPWLWFLTQSNDCKIYQKKTVPDIIKATFEKHGFGGDFFEMSLQRSYDVWDYCCQYREPSYDFIRRLMQIEGLYFFFKHEANKHVLVITDDKVKHQPCPQKARFRQERSFSAGFSREEDTILTWQAQRAVRPNKFTHTDYNFKTPKLDLKHEEPSQTRMGADRDLEVYDYPGQYEEKPHAQDWGKLRAQEQEVEHKIVEGTSSCRDMVAGFKFDLTEHSRRDQNDNFTLLEVTHSGTEGAFVAGSDSEEGFYENSFRAMPSNVQYRIPEEIVRQDMAGVQTAMVVGKEGEEIDTDEYGRVKVRFHWDRHSSDSYWVRVMQPWAGANWGQIWIPRIGQEVVVDFEEGDPDRPIVIGGVYNAQSMPPYTLPANKTRMGVKTRSTKGGDASTFNELRFEDKKGEEHIYLHGEKDLVIQVENDRIENIGRDKQLQVEREEITEIGSNRHVHIKGNDIEKVDGDRILTVQGAYHEQFNGDSLTESTGQIHHKATGRIVIDATMGVTLMCGGNFIEVNMAGVTIQGTMVLINSGGVSSGPGNPVITRTPSEPKKPVSLNSSGLP